MLPALKPRIPDLILDYAAADWRKVGDWFFMEENYQKAAMAYSKTLTVPPTNDNQCMTMYALAKYHIGDLASCRWAINEVFLLEPGNAFATHVEGLLAQAEEDWDAAELALLESVAKMPEQPDFRLNLAYLYQILGRFKDAEIQYSEVIKRDPTHLRARFFRSMSLLTQGFYEEGFKEYETRYSMIPVVPQVGKPIWRGVEDLTGKTILLCAEQGLGDAIQFARYGKWLKNKYTGVHVNILARPEYCDILRCISGIDYIYDDIKFYAEMQAAAELDFFLVPLMSMPGLSLENGRPWFGDTPYLSVPPNPSYWAVKTGALKVGFCWQGNKNHANDRFRSIPPKFLTELVNDPRVFAINLQHDQPNFGAMSSFPIPNIKALAQLIETLDLVITVDTAVAHIAGALGKEVWMMAASNPDWRWTDEGDRTPWYSSMRIFRQTHPLDWGPVVQAIQEELVLKLNT